MHRVDGALDVESLFTNVPVAPTINIILKQVYEHDTLLPPDIPKETLEKLLKICTTQTPVHFNGNMYLQKDGVSMGSPLGCTFADFYMSHLEKKLLSQSLISNPIFYYRYVDDVIAIFKNKNHIKFFINRLSTNSVLKFTSELMTNNSFHFLDINMIISGGKVNTSVFIKPTDTGSYPNFSSHTPISL